MEKEDEKTVGQVLRAAREARGISREEAAAATRIKKVFLAAMEEDDYHLLPDEHYVLRFLREYSAFLDLDSQGVQRRFSQQIARDRGSLAVFPVKRTVTLSLRRLLPVLLVLAVLVPVVFIGLSLLANRPERTERSEVLRKEAVVRTPPAMEETPGPVAKAIPAIPDRPTPSDAPEATYTLRAKTKEMTWMLVTIDGRETRDVLLREGETWEWRAQEGFVVTIGNAGGVELMLNGRSLPPLGEAGQVIRDLRVPAEYAPPTETP
jgi:transcriptional regulator with XRE-family HTH domain